jgi:hypothetical protein
VCIADSTDPEEIREVISIAAAPKTRTSGGLIFGDGDDSRLVVLVVSRKGVKPE